MNVDNAQYLSYNGQKIKFMPTQEFINLSDNPVFENLSDWFKKHNKPRIDNLMSGKSIFETFGIDNYYRILERYNEMQDIIKYQKG